MNPGDKVVCIKKYYNLSINKVYDICEICYMVDVDTKEKYMILVIGDDGNKQYYYPKFFRLLSLNRDILINNIL